MEARARGLRAFVDTIANQVQTLALPESHLEAELCVRSLTVSERALQLPPVVESEVLNDKEAHLRKEKNGDQTDPPPYPRPG